MRTEQEIISPANRYVVGLGIALVTGIIVFSFWKDIHGDGIAGTLLFDLVSYLAYPIYYGLCAAMIWGMVNTMLLAPSYIVLRNGWLCIAGRPKGEISHLRAVRVEKNWIGLTRIVFKFSDDSEAGVKAILLTAPAVAVVRSISHVIPPQYQ